MLDDIPSAKKAVIDLKRLCAVDLFPNTPIEVQEGEGRIHFSVEGQWDSYEHTFQSAKRHIKEIMTVNSRNWAGIYPMLRPEWGGWVEVNQRRLAHRCVRLVPRDATLVD